MKLYDAPGARSMAVHVALREIGANFDSVAVDLAKAWIGAPGSARRLAVVEWLGFVSTELHKVFSPWLWHMETAASTRQEAKDEPATRFAELDALLMPLTPYPHLKTYLDRVSQRPRVQDALRAEGSVK